MILRFHPKRRTCNGRQITGSSLTCNNCKKSITLNHGYFSCENDCDWDYCYDCGLQTEQVCSEGHKLIHYPANNRKLRNNPDGIPYRSNEPFLNCNSCRNNFNVAPHGYFSCEHRCDFDICPKCALCDGSHKLKIQTGVPKRYLKAGHPSSNCDRCRRQIMPQECNQGYMACTACDTDICRNCIPRAC